MKESKKTSPIDRSYIKSVFLEGFQVFAQPTTIPLGPITLLFGPNSSGKSAIEDGLKALNSVIKNNFRGPIDTTDPFLGRCWRREGEENFSPSMTLGATMIIPTDLAGAVAHSLERQEIESEIDWREGKKQCEVEIKVKIKKTEECRPTIELECEKLTITLGINNCEILCIESGEKIGINLNHPLIPSIPINKKTIEFAKKKNNAAFEYQAGWIWIKSLITFLEHGEIDVETLKSFIRADEHEKIKNKSRRPLVAEDNEAITELCNIFNAIYSIAIGNCTSEYEHVEPSRKTPSRQDLTHLIERFSENELQLRSDPAYKQLAESCLAESIRQANKIPIRTEKHSLIEGINDALTNHLFIDSGYSISSHVRYLVGQGALGSNAPSSHLNLEDLDAIVTIKLLDSKGTELDFDEVGSGLGYVLPVLASVYGTSTVAVIQQPELHLHPALQAALADVFIQNALDHKQLIVETHSEHFLLRILKRIRQTTKGMNTSELLISPEDVVILYFEPTLKDGTRVRKLRISADGDFLDRWPRGFFTERDHELFDE